MTNCKDCYNHTENGCALNTLMPPPRFHDGWCDHYEGYTENGELRVDKDRFRRTNNE